MEVGPSSDSSSLIYVARAVLLRAYCSKHMEVSIFLHTCRTEIQPPRVFSLLSRGSGRTGTLERSAAQECTQPSSFIPRYSTHIIFKSLHLSTNVNTKNPYPSTNVIPMPVYFSIILNYCVPSHNVHKITQRLTLS